MAAKINGVPLLWSTQSPRCSSQGFVSSAARRAPSNSHAQNLWRRATLRPLWRGGDADLVLFVPISHSNRYSSGCGRSLYTPTGATRRRLARNRLSCPPRVLVICFNTLPQSRQQATNDACLGIRERMVAEPDTDTPHANSVCPRESYPISSLDGSQSQVSRLQKVNTTARCLPILGEDLNKPPSSETRVVAL